MSDPMWWLKEINMWDKLDDVWCKIGTDEDDYWKENPRLYIMEQLWAEREGLA